MSHILAVLSPEPLASRSLLGFQAQINTSLSWPRKTRALDSGISMLSSMSMGTRAAGVPAPPPVDDEMVPLGAEL